MKIIVQLKNPQGLHMRPCSALVNLSKQFDAEIFVHKNGNKAKTDSILDLLSLGVPQGAVEIEATGKDAEKALNAVEKFCAEFEL